MKRKVSGHFGDCKRNLAGDGKGPVLVILVSQESFAFHCHQSRSFEVHHQRSKNKLPSSELLHFPFQIRAPFRQSRSLICIRTSATIAKIEQLLAVIASFVALVSPTCNCLHF
ncbi:hypothetical protein V6N13_031011 [Hibiscus sabdariffa]